MPDSTCFPRTPLAVLDHDWMGFPVVDGKNHYGVFVNKLQTVAQVAKLSDADLPKNVRIFRQGDAAKWLEMQLEAGKPTDLEMLDILIENM